jgi:hypothetical protein
MYEIFLTSLRFHNCYKNVEKESSDIKVITILHILQKTITIIYSFNNYFSILTHL